MTYRSKRTRSEALDAVDESSSKKISSPMPSQSSGSDIATGNISNAQPNASNSSIRSSSCQTSYTWGPFGPPRVGKSNTTKIKESESIWKIPPTLNSGPNSPIVKSKVGTSRDIKPTGGSAILGRPENFSSINAHRKASQPQSLKSSQPQSLKSSQPNKMTAASSQLNVIPIARDTCRPTSAPDKMSAANSQLNVAPIARDTCRPTSAPDKMIAASSHPSTVAHIARDTSTPMSNHNCTENLGTPQNMNEHQESIEPNMSSNTESFVPRRPASILAWKLKFDFDAKEQIVSIDDDENYKVLSGSIQPIDVWNNTGRRYFVEFNNLHQPIMKSGSLLVRFLGTISKMATFCPISANDWHDVSNYCKAAIIGKIREKFVIPDEKIYDAMLLQRVAKCWRNWKCELKRKYYKPKEKSHEAHYLNQPNGYTTTDWAKLVDYWFSEKGQRFSQSDRMARASQNQPHTMGCGSYANRRANYEEIHGKEMSLIKLWEDSHKRKDGSFIQGSSTEDFLDDVKSKAEMIKLGDKSNFMSQREINEEAFQVVLNGDEVPQRPQGYGFGVKKSDVQGIQGLLTKDGSRKVKERLVVLDNTVGTFDLKNRNEELEKQNKQLSNQLSENNMMLQNLFEKVSLILDAVQSGNTSTELIDAVKSSLNLPNPKVQDDAIHDNGRTGNKG